MINFNVYYGDFNQTIISLENDKTIFDLKLTLVSALDYDFNGIKIIMENYGILDNDDSLELPLNLLGLDSTGNKIYALFIQNLNNPEDMWKNFCTEKIIGKYPITQPGYIINDIKSSPVCLACRMFCQNNEQVTETILENNFFCMCAVIVSDSSSNKCLFADCNSYQSEKELVFKNINSILTYHSLELYKREKAKIEEINNIILERSFEFERSIKFGLQRVFMYEDKIVKEKVLSKIPIEEIKQEAQDNSKESGLNYKDEFVKSLLFWFKKKFFTWCDKPKCLGCDKVSDCYIESQTPNDEEKSWLASRTEVYNCSTCNLACRFPRFNNPAKLCETKTGRCGEWANLFGCVLRAFDYEVRFIDNFEDHVWNEYWSESLSRWIHVDSCEGAWDTPLIYEQGWGRNMTFILAYSVTGIYDVTRRYVKNWNLIASRRTQFEVNKMKKSFEIENNKLRERMPAEMIQVYYERDLCENMELMKLKSINEAELVGRQSGSEEWRQNRGEIKK